MITSIYQGGLGNILFQIAAGLTFAKKHQETYKINPNLHIGKGQGNQITQYLNNILSKIEKTDHVSTNIYDHITNNYIDIPHTADLCLKGYYQNFNFFREQEKFIKETFHFEYLDFNKKFEKKILTIHVRTGDYYHHPHFNILNKQYYENCLNRLDLKNYDVFLISDYPEEAKKYIPSISYKIFHKSELADLFLISQSDACIISNSTFAWWGSFLGKDKENIFAPAIWCKDNEPYENIYSDNMTKINF